MREPPPGAGSLRGDGLEAKAAGDLGSDEAQQRVAEAGDHDAQQEEGDAERDRGVRGADRHRRQAERGDQAGAVSCVLRAAFATGLPFASFRASSALFVPAGSPLSTAKRPICA